MSFKFQFTSTRQDLLDGYDAQLRAGSGMRPWVRWCAIAVGGMGLFGAVVSTPEAVAAGQWWRYLGAYIFCGVILWQFLFEPIFRRRQVRADSGPDQKVALEFGDGGIAVEAEGAQAHKRAWTEVDVIVPDDKGILMGFASGGAHWLPARAFADEAQKKAFLDFVVTMITKR